LAALQLPDDVAPPLAAPHMNMPHAVNGDVLIYQLRKNEDGDDEMTANIIGFARRPPAIDTVAEAYALQIRDRRMAPKYRPGDIVVVNPAGIPHPLSGVVALSENRLAVCIGEYVSESDTEYELSFCGDGATCRLPKSRYPLLHSICAVYPN
jgi:hypothetical protein